MAAKNSPVELRKPVGIWLRVSTEDQAQGDSPEHHEKRARFYAEAKGWIVQEVYHLEAVSGKSVLQHPEAQRMLKDVRRGHISGLIFSKLARLARNTKELLEFADIFQGLSADLISLQESIDTSTPAGRLFYTMIAAMAQWEREEIVDRINASVIVRARLGKPLNGKISYGYQWLDGKIEPHPQEAPVRRLIYELFADVKRKKTVAKMLNERGCRTRDGKPFTDTVVDFLLRDPTAKGKHRANYTKRSGTRGQRRQIKPESDWIWTDVKPIVSVELWEQCNRYLDERIGTRPKRPGRRPVHLFAGLAFCQCGKKMYVPANTPKYVCQACRTKIPIVDLEAVFHEQLKGFFLSPEAVNDHLQKADEHLQQRHTLLASLEAEQSKLKSEMDRVYRLYVDGHIDGHGFSKVYKPLQERRGQLEDEIPKLQADVDLFKVNELSADKILTEAKGLYDRWPQLTMEEKRRVIESITDRIEIGKDSIDITLCHCHSSEELTKEQGKL